MGSFENKMGQAGDSQQEAFRQRCRSAGLRITPQREAIFQALTGSVEHPTVDTVYQEVRRLMPHISFDTVNRTLNTLCEIGAAFVVPGTDNVRRFDGNLSDHQHFRCIKCKRIVDFHHGPFDNVPVPDVLAGRFIVMRKTVCLEGFCDQCTTNPMDNVTQTTSGNR
ncbi:MAG: transcriptional repressor [Sedimentisphaerales bacterium]|nr:transcriptional repressor [Sedimentisphaerales bacterium]